MRKTLEETSRRRIIQVEFNTEHNITPESIQKNISDILSSLAERDYVTVETPSDKNTLEIHPNKIPALMKKLNKEMFAAAKNLEFEKAAEIRDQIRAIESAALKYGAA